MSPDVDVIIACRNPGALVGDAVASALAQREVLTRVIVVDDASDAPVEASDHHWPAERVTVLRHDDHRGQAATINRGLALSEAPFVAFLDHDDLWPTGRCRVLVDALTASDGDLAYGCQVIFNDGDAPLLDGHLPEVAATPGPLSGTSMLTRTAIARLGPLNESLRLGAFIDWVATGRRLSPPLREIPVQSVTLLRRSHAANITRTRTHEFVDYVKVVALHRQASGLAPGDDDG